jgi:hypothetical protein
MARIGPQFNSLEWQALTYYIGSIRKIVHVVEELYDPARTMHHPLETHYGSDVDEPQLIDQCETLVN